MQTQNSHSQASSAYGTVAREGIDQRELEGQLLLKSAQGMQALVNNWEAVNHEDVDVALTYNRKLWTVFYDTAMENPEGDRPNDLRSNIINLANFIFKRSVEVLCEREKAKQKDMLDILITINRDVAAGLLTKQEDDSTQESSIRSEESFSSDAESVRPEQPVLSDTSA